MTSHMELVDSVDRFIGYFRVKMETIDKAEFKESKPLFQKILYIGVLDALAGTTTYSKKQKNWERITSFVKQFAGWQEHDRVSLPHLVQLLQKVPDPEFSPLRQFAFSLFDQWSPGHVVKISEDPPLTDIKKHWPASMPKPLEGITIEHLQHINLFYKYRNNLVHELREPGYGAEFENDVEPFYCHMTDIETEGQTWELVYPVGFYQRICRTAIDRLREYYVQQRLDPYSLCSFGTYWIEDLNE